MHGDGTTLRVAMVQVAGSRDPVQARSAVPEACRAAAAQGPVDLLVLPEAVQRDLGRPRDDVAPDAESLDGPFVHAVRAVAAELDAVVVAGMLEAPPSPGDRPVNTVVAVDPVGLLAAYRKVHLYDAFGYRESDRLQPGPLEACVVPVAGVPVGIMTCYDLRFPEQARVLVDAGAEVLLVPAAWLPGPDKLAHWTTLLQARAIENTVFVVGVGQPAPRYCGRSLAVDPMGHVVAALDDGPGHRQVRLDLDEVSAARRRNPSLANRRWQVSAPQH